MRGIDMSKADDNKAIAGRWFTEFWGEKCNLDVVDAIAAPDMLLEYSLHDGRRGVGHYPQATAPILDSTEAAWDPLKGTTARSCLADLTPRIAYGGVVPEPVVRPDEKIGRVNEDVQSPAAEAQRLSIFEQHALSRYHAE
jgi:hypothetical protein